ncbi:MAG: hypothetical protein IKS52_02025 [Clostridia bacterium]|nr:hypothetical protein [Clostridia bacterium]
MNLNDAFPPVDEGFERGMNRAFEAIRKEKVMRHKMKFTLLAAALVILALAGTAVAAGFNVIEFFAQNDQRLERIATDSVVTTSAPANVESEALGASSIWFDSAYFDGEALIVGYVMENSERIEAFTPTDEQLAAMEKAENPIIPTAWDEAEASLFAEYYEAVEQGRPYDFITYSVYPSDHIRTDDGIDIGPYCGHETVTEAGRRLILREMETPLPEDIRSRDSLELHMTIWRQTTWYYYDGKAFYWRSEREQAGEAVTTVAHSSAKVCDFEGVGVYNGVPITASAHSSRLRVTLTMDAETDAFPNEPDLWYDCLMLDEQGRALQVDSIDVSPKRLTVSYYYGNETPERLSAYILALTEEEWEEWDEDKLMQSVEPIILNPCALR